MVLRTLLSRSWKWFAWQQGDGFGIKPLQQIVQFLPKGKFTSVVQVTDWVIMFNVPTTFNSKDVMAEFCYQVIENIVESGSFREDICLSAVLTELHRPAKHFHKYQFRI